jgi:hypothetical protein
VLGTTLESGNAVDVAAERTKRIVLGPLRCALWSERTVVELVVAECRRVVAERVVQFHHRQALVLVRLKRALKHVAAIEQEHGAVLLTCLGPQRAQCFNVPGEQWHRLNVAMKVVGADHGRGERFDGRCGYNRHGGVRWIRWTNRRRSTCEQQQGYGPRGL